MKLLYQAYDKSGKEVSDTIDAPDAAEATAQLRRRGLFVAEIGQADKAAAGARGAKGARMGGGKKAKHLAMFTRQLYVLVRSGTPLAQALKSIERQLNNEAWRAVIADLRLRLEEGASLSEAMACHGQYFSSIYRGLIVAGESSGNLPLMLDRLATLTQKGVHVRSTVVGALVYPSLLVSVALTVLILLLLLVIPRFAELFHSLDAPLPPTTSALIEVSKALWAYWWAMLGALAAAVLGVRMYLKTEGGRRKMDTLILRLPQIGRIYKSFVTARIVRLLGVLLESHVPVLQAMKLARGATTNCHYVEFMTRAEEAVAGGQPISSTFVDSKLFSPAVYEAAKSGEKSGEVGPLLLNLAEFLDDENEVLLKVLTSIIEPVILVLMGLIVGFVAVSMFLPLFDLTSMTGGGAS